MSQRKARVVKVFVAALTPFIVVFVAFAALVGAFLLASWAASQVPGGLQEVLVVSAVFILVLSVAVATVAQITMRRPEEEAEDEEGQEPQTKGKSAPRSAKSAAKDLKVFYVLGIAVLFVLGIVLGTVVAVEPRLLDKTCDALTNQLPETVPQWTVLRVRDDYGQPLRDEVLVQVEVAVDQALEVYEMPDRFAVDFGNLNYSLYPDAHVLPVAVLISTKLHLGLMQADGRMCGDFLFIKHKGSPELDRRIWVHEIGHFMGLSHEDGTWMHGNAAGSNPENDRFSARQLEIIDYWHSAGAPYKPHWKWE